MVGINTLIKHSTAVIDKRLRVTFLGELPNRPAEALTQATVGIGLPGSARRVVHHALRRWMHSRRSCV